MRLEVRFAGSGGQGIILSGRLLAEAAAAEGKSVVQTQEYGPAARLGASCTDVIVSDEEEIAFPKATRPDVLVALNQRSFDRFVGGVADGALVVVDTGVVVPVAGCVGEPFTELARTRLGNPIVANVIMLGYLLRARPVVGPDAVRARIEALVKPYLREVNVRAFEIGLQGTANGTSPEENGTSPEER